MAGDVHGVAVTRRARAPWPSAHHYPRVARLNEVLREVVAEEIERVANSDARAEMLTVTAVLCDPDLHHAKVLFASLSEDARSALEHARARLQASVAKQVKLKRTPQLSFAVDPAVVQGERVDEIIRSLHNEP